jgi:hypothetical protein
MLIAIAVVLVGIFFVATGRGGELAYEQADHAPLDLGPVSAADIALLRPPSAMWGYNMQVTDAALDQIARAMRERDVTIAYLQDQLAGVQRHGAYTVPRGAHARPGSSPTPPDAFIPLEAPDPFEAREPFETPGSFETPQHFEDPRHFEDTERFDDSERFEDPERFEAAEPFDASDDLEAPEDLADPESLEPLAVHGSPPAAEPPEVTPTATYRQTPLVLKASGPRPASAAEPHEITQPSEIPDVTQPSEVHDATEPPEVRDSAGPSAVLDSEARDTAETRENPVTPGEVPGPQGAFDTHGWWAEQQEAAQKERARRKAAGEEEAGPPDDDPLAAAEEQGW